MITGHYSQQEDDTIVQMMPDFQARDIAKALGRSIDSVKVRIWRLRSAGAIKRPPIHISDAARSSKKADAPVTLVPPITLNDDDELVARCIAEGGFPRAFVHDGMTYWINLRHAPWRHTPPEPVRRPRARALKAIPALASIGHELDAA